MRSNWLCIRLSCSPHISVERLDGGLDVVEPLCGEDCLDFQQQTVYMLPANERVYLAYMNKKGDVKYCYEKEICALIEFVQADEAEDEM